MKATPAGPRKSPGPERIREVLRGLLERSTLGERLAEADVVPEWADRVGPAISAVTAPLRVSRGSLIVAVRSSAWLMELQMMERQIREAINEGRKRGRIQRIRFVMDSGGGPESGHEGSS